jgi:hypothetical protein
MKESEYANIATLWLELGYFSTKGLLFPDCMLLTFLMVFQGCSV